MPAGVNTSLIKRTIEHLGRSEDALLPIMLMCVANGTLKPLITLSNKKEPPERKIYAAKREFLNELVALPVCAAFALGFRQMGAKLLAGASADKLSLLQNTVFSALGVISANFAVPTLASAIFHPIDKLTAPMLKRFQKPTRETPSAPLLKPPLSAPQFGHKPKTLIQPPYPLNNRANPFRPSVSLPAYGGVFR